MIPEGEGSDASAPESAAAGGADWLAVAVAIAGGSTSRSHAGTASRETRARVRKEEVLIIETPREDVVIARRVSEAFVRLNADETKSSGPPEGKPER